MEIVAKLFGKLLIFVNYCFDRIIINGYLSGLSRPEQMVYLFRQVVGVRVIGREVLSRRTNDYQIWVEPFARNRELPHRAGREGGAQGSACSALAGRSMEWEGPPWGVLHVQGIVGVGSCVTRGP